MPNRTLKDKSPDVGPQHLVMGYASGMDRDRWKVKPCGCTKADLPNAGKVMIRCYQHRGKPSKRMLCYFENGIVRRETTPAA